MANAFRHDPPRPDPAWVARTRLTERLARRFELRVLLVVAPAGYGKTAALAQALHATADADDRLDLWLQCEPGDADPDHLVGGILRSADLPATPGDATSVAEALLRYAPREVCLVLDDVHAVPAGSAGAALLDEIAELLPLNAHLVLSGRTRPSIRLARRQVAGEVEVLGRDDLEFDADEMDRLGADTEPDAARWPAWSSLARHHDRHGGAGAEYLREEIVPTLEPDDIATLTALSVLRYVDDRIVTAAAGRATSAAALLDDLPLVHHDGDGSFQLHDLWRQALVPPGPLPEVPASMVARVAEHQLEAGDAVGAAELFSIAGDSDGLRRAGVAMLALPLTGMAASEMRQVRDRCRELLPHDPITTMLDASIVMTGDERVSAARFLEAARLARETSAPQLESLAVQNAMNVQSILDPTGFPDELVERAEVLAAAGDDLAQLAAASMRAHRYRTDGDPERSAAELWTMVANRSPMAVMSQAFGYGDLGRPEEVTMPSGDDDPASTAARSGGQYLAQALWLRGEASPEIALELGSQLAVHADTQEVAHVQVSTNAVLALVAIAAGDHDAAQAFVDRAAAASNRTAAGHVRSFADLARAALVLVTRGESDAAPVLQQALLRTPMGNWPARPYLYSLPMVYVLTPSDRSVLDGCAFGPALTTALRAGQALVSIRDDGDPTAAAALPWHRPDLLRAHILPPHLAELGAAAASLGRPEVEAVLSVLPALRTNLEPVTRSRHELSATWARSRIALLPRRPPYELHVGLLGPTTLLRGTAPITDAAWARERVRELLAILALSGRASRHQIAERMWPDLPPDRAQANLRVNLHHLQGVLQPDRGEELPWFVPATGDGLGLVREGVRIDVEEFEQATASARRFDSAGRSTSAIGEYERAVELYRGGLLDDLQSAAWADPDRARLRSSAIAAMSRLGELVLARGEPERACVYAARALQIEPLHERAARLLAACLDAQDDRAGAARALATLIEALADHGLEPERSTLDQANRLGIR